MAQRIYELGLVSGLEAEAIGVPGQRTFRVNTHSRAGGARIWLEKEQLQELAATIERLLVEVAGAHGLIGPARGGSSLPFLGNPTTEFRAGRITLGYEQDSDRVTLAFDEYTPDDDDEDEEPDPLIAPDLARVEIEFTREQAQGFSRQALDVCSAGRPRCPLCGTPLDGPTHFCPRSNGHAPLPAED